MGITRISNTDETLRVETRHATSVLSLLHVLNIEITMSLMSGATNNQQRSGATYGHHKFLFKQFTN
jgi:hypothetical protein